MNFGSKKKPKLAEVIAHMKARIDELEAKDLEKTNKMYAMGGIINSHGKKILELSEKVEALEKQIIIIKDLD